MINTMILTGFFVSSQVLCMLYDHDRTVISFRARTDWTYFRIRQCTAVFAVADLFSCGDKCLCKVMYMLFRHIYDVKSKTLCRLTADTGKSSEFINKISNLGTIIIH